MGEPLISIFIFPFKKTHQYLLEMHIILHRKVQCHSHSETQEETHFQFYNEFKKHPVHGDSKGFLRAHTHSSIHTHTNNRKNKKKTQAERKKDGNN